MDVLLPADVCRLRLVEFPHLSVYEARDFDWAILLFSTTRRASKLTCASEQSNADSAFNLLATDFFFKF